MKNYVLFLTVTIVALFFVKFFDISYPLTITSTSRSTELAVVGEGKVDVTPDSASVNAGVTVNNMSSAEEAQKELAAQNNKVLAAVAKLGVLKKDIKTSNYSVYPNYSYENNISRISGYNGNATLTIKVRKVELLSKVIDEASRAGANEIQNTQFTVDNPNKFREEAREKAITNAREQAEKMARSLGIRLGRVTNIVESAGGGVVPMMYAEKTMMAGGGGGAPSFEQGTQTITSTVTLYFEKR